MKFAPFLLVLALLLAGCAGGKDSSTQDTSPTTSATVATPTTEAPPTDEFVPKFHTHDYWAGRDKLILFGPKKLPVGNDAMQETHYDENNQLILGRVDFDTKTDGEQVNLADSTDVVFQGTSKILVTVKWADTNIPGLRFYYKHAGTPIFTALGPVASGDTYEIDLKQGWADMPHQLSLSRWKFRLEAYNPQTSSYPVKPFVSRGEVEVFMEIVNGGEQFIDPPHPYFFSTGPVRYAGEVNGTLNNCLVVNNSRPGGQSLPVGAVAFSCGASPHGPIDYKVDGTHIVPWETTKMRLELYWNETAQGGAAPKPGIKLGLIFHAADSDVYRYPRAASTTANSAVYEVTVSEAMSDSPYATQSDWRYGVYPIIQDQRDLGGTFTGSFHVVTHAIKEGDTAGRGMGN